MSFAFQIASEVHTRMCRPRAPPTPPSSAASHPPAGWTGARSWGRREAGERHSGSESSSSPLSVAVIGVVAGGSPGGVAGRCHWLPPREGRAWPAGGVRRAVSLTHCWCPHRPASYVWHAHRSSRGELAHPPGWQRRSQQRAPRCGYPVPARACRSRRGGPLGRAAGPARAKSMCPPRACWPRAWAGQRRQVNSAAMRSECWGHGRLGSAVPSGSSMVRAVAVCRVSPVCRRQCC
jgi:hypothetical protein